MSPHHRTRRASMVSTARQVPTQKNTRAKERSHLSLQEPDKRARAHPHTHHAVCGGVVHGAALSVTVHTRGEVTACACHGLHVVEG